MQAVIPESRTTDEESKLESASQKASKVDPRRRSLSGLAPVLDAFGAATGGSSISVSGGADAGLMHAADHAVASLRDLVQAVGSGGAGEGILIRELNAAGVDELGWLQRLRDMLVQLNVLIEDHIEDLIREQSGVLREASDLASRLN